MAHTSWLTGSTKALGSTWRPCWAQGFNKGSCPSPASSPLHPATRRTMKILVPVRAKPFTIKPGTCGSTVVASNDAHDRSLIANAGFSRPMATPRRCTKAFTSNHGEVRLAHISHTKRGFHSCTHTMVLTHSRHQRFPSHINGLSLNMIIS